MSCPSCGYKGSDIYDRKYVVTTLRRCHLCQLLYRAPTTTQAENKIFYQGKYKQGFTTNLPNDEELTIYLDNGFLGTEKDYSTYIRVLECAGAKQGDRLFDFGCSWGYGSWQFKRYGFEVESFEISGPRAEFARNKLGIKVSSSLCDVSASCDIFFSSHVLEHVPSVQEIIDLGFRILKPGGLFVAFTPNGSTCYRQKNPDNWHRAWGLVHPNVLDEFYYKKVFSGRPFFLSSDPYVLQEIVGWKENQKIFHFGQLDGAELLVIARK